MWRLVRNFVATQRVAAKLTRLTAKPYQGTAMSPEKLTSWSAVVQAAAAIASLIVACVLVYITHKYVKLTGHILSETAKARTATEAAANAALESVRLTKRELEEEKGSAEAHLISTLTRAI